MSSNEGDNLAVREGVPLPNNTPDCVIAQAYGRVDSQSAPGKRLNGSIVQSAEIAPDTTKNAGVQSGSHGNYFEGQKSYVVLLDKDQNGVPDQMTGAYSLIYTLPDSTKAGPVHSGVEIIDPRTEVVKSDRAETDSHRAKQFHFEGTITIPKVKIKQGSMAGQEVTVQFDDSNFQLPFVEQDPSSNRVHTVHDEWVNGRIIPKEKSPEKPVVDGYLYVDE